MTDKTEKQASPGPFDDKNLGELFQIALVNAPSPSKTLLIGAPSNPKPSNLRRIFLRI